MIWKPSFPESILKFDIIFPNIAALQVCYWLLVHAIGRCNGNSSNSAKDFFSMIASAMFRQGQPSFPCLLPMEITKIDSAFCEYNYNQKRSDEKRIWSRLIISTTLLWVYEHHALKKFISYIPGKIVVIALISRSLLSTMKYLSFH